MEKSKSSIIENVFRILQGALIGLGAVLPGISGGVLCVIFGIYKPVMELLSHPFKNFKTHVPKLLPIIVGIGLGVLGIAKILAFFLTKYEAASVCLFIGLITGMIPALWREAGEKGRNKFSYIALTVALIFIFTLLIILKTSASSIVPGIGWYVFCGVCVALSVIAPGMSFSTLLMPLTYTVSTNPEVKSTLYTLFVDAIGSFNFGVLIPAGIGALITVICFAKAVNSLFEKHYSVAFHAIVGIVIAATIMIVPIGSFFKMNFLKS